MNFSSYIKPDCPICPAKNLGSYGGVLVHLMEYHGLRYKEAKKRMFEPVKPPLDNTPKSGAE